MKVNECEKNTIMALVFIVIIFSQYKNSLESLENLSIAIGVGHDIEKKINGVIEQKVPVSMYIF